MTWPESPLLGGNAWPLGWSVGFVERPLDDVVAAVDAWPAQRSAKQTAHPDAPLARLLGLLAALEAPHSRRLLVGTGGGWTAYLDNAVSGGDPVAWTSHLSQQLGVRGVTATHVPADQHPYPTTALELFGPEGEPPLMYQRTLNCGIGENGRWSFAASGDVQPFERPAAYRARRIKDRFTRAILVEYLLALGIDAGDPTWFRGGMLFESEPVRGARRLTIDEARAELSQQPS